MTRLCCLPECNLPVYKGGRYCVEHRDSVMDGITKVSLSELTDMRAGLEECSAPKDYRLWWYQHHVILLDLSMDSPNTARQLTNRFFRKYHQCCEAQRKLPRELQMVRDFFEV